MIQLITVHCPPLSLPERVAYTQTCLPYLPFTVPLPFNLVLLALSSSPGPLKSHQVFKSSHCSSGRYSLEPSCKHPYCDSSFAYTLLDFCDSPPHVLSSLAISNTGFGSLSVYFISHLPHIILTFPRVKRHPLRKPLERLRAQPSTLRKILRQIHKAWFMPLILARTHWAFLVWAVRQDSKGPASSIRLLPYSLISSMLTRAEGNICHHFTSVLYKNMKNNYLWALKSNQDRHMLEQS